LHRSHAFEALCKIIGLKESEQKDTVFSCLVREHTKNRTEALIKFQKIIDDKINKLKD
jgi:hypothetical protein